MERKQQLLDSVLVDLTQFWAKLHMLKDEVGRDEPGRELALAITRFEEGCLWLGQVQKVIEGKK